MTTDAPRGSILTELDSIAVPPSALSWFRWIGEGEERGSGRSKGWCGFLDRAPLYGRIGKNNQRLLSPVLGAAGGPNASSTSLTTSRRGSR